MSGSIEYWARRAENLDRKLRKAHEEIDELKALISEHHSVGVFDDVRIGSDCPVCSPASE